jgi:hypothetical protein
VPFLQPATEALIFSRRGRNRQLRKSRAEAHLPTHRGLLRSKTTKASVTFNVGLFLMVAAFG